MFEISFFPKGFIWVAHPQAASVTLKDVTDGYAVFVSGKLMDPEFVRRVIGRHIPFTPAVARNYARGEHLREKRKILLLEPKPGSMVLGVLLLNLTRDDKERLDKFERVPTLRRKARIKVSVGTCERMADTYLLAHY